MMTAARFSNLDKDKEEEEVELVFKPIQSPKIPTDSPNDSLVSRWTHHNGDCLLTETGVVRFAEVPHVHGDLVLHPATGAHRHVLTLALKEEMAAIKRDVVRITRNHTTPEALEVVRRAVPAPVLHALAVKGTDTYIYV